MKFRILIALIAIMGVLVMGYLTQLHYAPDESAFCNLGEGLSCDAVNKSEYAEVFGIPVSILGILYFLMVLAAALLRYNKATFQNIAFLSIIFLGPSLYLSGIEVFVLQNICVFCELSKVLILAIAILALIAFRPVQVTRAWYITAIVLAILVAGITALTHANQGPGELYSDFAQCLTDKGFKVYGSATCVFCARQRAMFDDAFQYIEEIECDPRNPHPETERCVAKQIEHTPTWIQEDAEGNELYRFDSGVQQFDALAGASGCELPVR